MSEITFNTEHYAAKHGKAPHHNAKGDWLIIPPRHLGKRPYLFNDMKFSDVKKMILKRVHETQAHGEFVLKP